MIEWLGPIVSMILGIIVGEFISQSSFGKIKSTAMRLVEIGIFYAMFIFGIYLYYYYSNAPVDVVTIQITLIYGVVAFLSDIGANGIVTLIGFSGEKIKRKLKLREASKIVRIIIALGRRGMSKREIESILKESGIKVNKHLLNMISKAKEDH